MKNASEKAEMDFQSHLRDNVGGGIAPTLIRLPDLQPAEPVADDDSPVWGDSAVNQAVEIGTTQRSDSDREASFNVHSPLQTGASVHSGNAPLAIADPMDEKLAQLIENHSIPKSAPAVTLSTSPTHIPNDSTESFGTKALGVIASRKMLLILLALIAGWAIFAPRRSVDAKRDSDALIAKEPVAVQAESEVASIVKSNSSPSPIQPTAPSPMATAATSKPGLVAPNSNRSKADQDNADPNKNETGMTLPPPASIAQQGTNEAPATPAERSFTKDASLASMSVQKEPLAPWNDPNRPAPTFGLDVADFNPLQQPPVDSPPRDSVPSKAALAEQQMVSDARMTQEPPRFQEPERIPAPTPTQTPDEITNWMDYLPPLPTASDSLGLVSDVSSGDARSLNVKANFAGAVSKLGNPIEANRIPTTSAPNAPDFSDVLPVGGVGGQSPSPPDFNTPPIGYGPDARVATPGYSPEFNLRR